MIENYSIDEILNAMEDLQNIDIDVVNLVIKYILTNNKLPRHKEKTKTYSLIDNIGAVYGLH